MGKIWVTDNDVDPPSALTSAAVSAFDGTSISSFPSLPRKRLGAAELMANVAAAIDMFALPLVRGVGTLGVVLDGLALDAGWAPMIGFRTWE